MRFSQQIYIGFTRNLRKRYAEHNDGTSPSTKRYAPWRLAYYEAFSQGALARARESHLKNNGNPMRELKKRIGLTESMKSGKGFTLVETLVAVTILTLAVAGPLFTANRAIVAAQNARDQLIASYLAQEGIEYMRAIRDDEYLAAYEDGGANVSTSAWTNFHTSTSQCNATSVSAKACTLNPWPVASPQLNSCDTATVGSCAPLNKTSSGIVRYTQSSAGTVVTRFTRTIQVIDVSPNDARIVSTVSWNFHSVPYSVSISDHLTPWQ